MRHRRPLAALAVAALLAVAACDVPDDATPPAAAPRTDDAAAPPVPLAAPAQLCEAIPGDVVAEATGRSPVTVDGVGTQCSWRAGAGGADGQDVVLQGSFIDARSFEVGRRDAAAADLSGLGDRAYLVQAGSGSAPTLYVLDGSRAFALWLGGASPTGAERTLRLLAGQVLSS